MEGHAEDGAAAAAAPAAEGAASASANGDGGAPAKVEGGGGGGGASKGSGKVYCTYCWCLYSNTVTPLLGWSVGLCVGFVVDRLGCSAENLVRLGFL